ncbi:hypothetical protein [Tropicimonas sp.]|uniref:hypothetical protein n=1 Tax=Tropicimonas sp. TaxID=2067044 RepID=UPI003A8839DD
MRGIFRSLTIGTGHGRAAAWLAALLWIVAAGIAAPQGFGVGELPLSATIAANGGDLRLSWAGAEPPRTGSVIVSRRRLGETGRDSWRAFPPLSGRLTFFSDSDFRPGTAYEYQVQRFDARSGALVDSGYWTAGIEVPAVETRGTALLVVDETLAGALASRLDRFALDLAGDGWRVVRHQTPPGAPDTPVETLARARALKAWVVERFDSDPAEPRALILVGQVPMVMSGRVAPDGHGNTPHASDLFYADMDQSWPDDGAGHLRPNSIPSGNIEMMVGRIDFSHFRNEDPQAELRLLEAYFDKNHHWRNGLLGDLRQAYGKTDYLESDIAGLRNIVGPENVITGGHEDTGGLHPWLWGVDFGPGDIELYDGPLSIKAIFSLNFGSHKQRIERANNPMRAVLAQPWYPLAVAWGARPAWRLHAMALGLPVGDAQIRTVNNGKHWMRVEETMEYLPTGTYLMRNPIWVNLLGDPTLHAFPLDPVRALSADEGPDGVTLAWTIPDNGEQRGARVFRASGPGEPFVAIDGGIPVGGTEFTDPAPIPGARYMVRSHGLKTVAAGSFFTLGQGAFAAVGSAPSATPDIALGMTAGQSLRLAPPGAGIFAVVSGPSHGSLARDGSGWTYTAPVGFTGTVTLHYSLFDAISGDQGTITIEMTRD